MTVAEKIRAPSFELDTPIGAPATGWQRFWAKTLDLQVFSFIVGIMFGVVFPSFFSAEIFNGRGGNLIASCILLPFVLVLDAVIMATNGQTPGKFLLGVKLNTHDGMNLPVKTALRRNFLIYTRGMFLGLPLINLIAYRGAAKDIKSNGETFWDRELQTRVVSVGSGIPRTLLSIMFIGIVMVMIQSAMNKVHRVTLKAPIPATYTI